MQTYGAKDLKVDRGDDVIELCMGPFAWALLSHADARWLQRKLGEALLKPVDEQLELAPRNPLVRDGETYVLPPSQRASWCRR